MKDKTETTFKFFLLSRATRSISLVFVTLALPLYLFVLHYNVISIGIIYFTVIAFNALLSIILGALGDRVGYKKSLIISEVFPILALSLLAISTNFFVIVFAAIIGGITGAAGGMKGVFSPGSTALIVSNWEDEKKRVNRLAEVTYVGSAFAIIGSIFLYLRGFLIDNFGAVGSFQLLFGVSAIFILISMVSLFFVNEVKRPVKTTRVMRKESLRYSLRIIIANFVNGFGLGIALPLLPLWFELRFGVSTSTIGVLYTISYAATAVAGYFVARHAHLLSFLALKAASATRVLQGVTLILIAFSPLFLISSIFFVIRSSIAGFGSPLRSMVNMRGINSEDYGTASSIMGLSSRLSETL